MNIFISYRSKAVNFVDKLANRLEASGHTVFYDRKIPIGSDFYKSIAEMIAQSDVIIAVFVGQNNDNVTFEVASGIADPRKKLIPIVYEGVGEEKAVIPFMLERFALIVIHDLDTLEDNVFKNVLTCVSVHEATKASEAEQEAEASARVQKGIVEHIAPIIQSLERRERSNKLYSFFLYLISAIMLVSTIAVAIMYLKKINIGEMEVASIIAIATVYLFISIMMVSISKFLFTLAKSFMVEAVRASDRLHAISFGKFYLHAFNESVTREEILKVFSSWNIDNGGTGFKDISGDDYDPKLLDKILDTIGLAKKD